MPTYFPPILYIFIYVYKYMFYIEFVTISISLVNVTMMDLWKIKIWDEAFGLEPIRVLGRLLSYKMYANGN